MVALTTAIISKSLADAAPGEVGIYMQGRARALLFRAKQAEKNIGISLVIGEAVGVGGGPYRSFVITEENFSNLSEVLFFPSSKIRPDFGSLLHHYEYSSLDIFQIGEDSYLVLPLEIRGFWDHAFLNLTSSELLLQVPHARGRWYFKNWSLVVPTGDGDEVASLYDWPIHAA